jgi:hypothetical protein
MYVWDSKAAPNPSIQQGIYWLWYQFCVTQASLRQFVMRDTIPSGRAEPFARVAVQEPAHGAIVSGPFAGGNDYFNPLFAALSWR